MEAQGDSCPSDERLIAFQLGELPESDLDSVRVHQEVCARCEGRAQLLDERTDHLIDDLRRTVGGGERDAGGRPVPQAYELDEAPLGSGSMGVVYRARHLELGRVVALKMIAGPSSRASELFTIEAKAVAQLQHPNIVQIFEIGHHQGRPFLALEFVEGGSLEQRLDGRPWPPNEAAGLVRSLALAADYAHRQGIVHCDLKPSNILITTEGVPKIADFGVAKWRGSAAHWGDEGGVAGTPRYMAPEQAGGEGREVGPSADVYSLGVILYELLTGRTPYEAATSRQTLDLARVQEPTPPRQWQRRVSKDLESVVLTCLNREPSRRYADGRELAEDLGRLLEGAPIRARPGGRAERAYRWARRNPAPVGLLVVLALWVGTLGAFRWQHDLLMRRYDADLKSLTLPESHSLLEQPVLVVQAADRSVRLPAKAAAVHGTSVALQPSFGNLGYWQSPDDRAVWMFRLDRGGTFEVALDYSNALGDAANAFEIRAGAEELRGETTGTGAWSVYRSFPVGLITLPRGIHRLEVKPARAIHGALFDLRSIKLTPK